MTVLTGSSGELRYQGQRVGRCRNFSLDISRDSLETTAVGSYDKEYVEGMRGATGNATIIYDSDDLATRNILNSIFSNTGGEQNIELILNAVTGTSFNVRAFITSVNTPVSVGDVVACSINFQVSGPIEGRF